MDDFEMYKTGMTREEVREWVSTHNRSRQIRQYPNQNGLRMPRTSMEFYRQSLDNYESFIKAMASASPRYSELPFDHNALIEAHSKLDGALRLLQNLKERELPYAAKLIEALLEASACFLKLVLGGESGACWAEQFEQAIRESPSMEKAIDFRAQSPLRIKPYAELDQIRRTSTRSSPTLLTPPISPTFSTMSESVVTMGEAWYDTERPGNLKFVGVFVTDEMGTPRKTIVSRPFEIAHDYRVVSEVVRTNGTVPNMVCFQMVLHLPRKSRFIKTNIHLEIVVA